MTRAYVAAGDGSLTLVEHPAPSPGEQDVVVAVLAAAVPRWQLHQRADAGVPGWSCVGRVVAAGEQALGLLDRTVVVGSIDPCGQCEVCRRGGGTVCPRARGRGHAARGTLAERVTVAARWVVPQQDAGLGALDAEAQVPLALLGGEATLAYTAYARSDVSPREPVLVVGRSAIAVLLVEILRAKGVCPVVLAAREEDPWVVALGARGARVVAPCDGPRDELVARVTAALVSEAGGNEATGARPWRIFACEPSALPLAFSVAGPRASVTVITPAQADVAAPASLWTREVTVLGVAAPSPELLLETAALVAKGQLHLDDVASVCRPEALVDAAARELDAWRALVVDLRG